MRAVVQRVSRASVTVDDRTTGAIEHGFLVLLGVAVDDDDGDARYVAEKIANLRIFRDDAGLMNRSLRDVDGAVLLVSQFTLHGDVRKGRRPSFIAAAREEVAQALYQRTGDELGALGVPVKYGEFGADMQVSLVNTGPVTILIDSKKAF